MGRGRGFTVPMVSLILTLLVTSTPTEYDAARTRLEKVRLELAAELGRAKTNRQRRDIYQRGRSALLDALSRELFVAWYGTPWAFGGHSDRPGEGAIACGTFVGTVLAHAGFNLDRIAMGRLASEHIALSLTEERNLRRFRNRPVAEVTQAIEAWGPGLYMVGLDYHAGLALVDADGKAHFVHSSYYGTRSVRSEPFVGDNPLADSKYRVFAKLLDDRMIRRWLRGHRFPARKSS